MIENAPNVNATNHFEEILSIVTDTLLQTLLEKVECFGRQSKSKGRCN